MSRHNRKIAVIDCETDPFKYNRKPKPFVWGFYDGRTFLHFYDTEEFINHSQNFKGIIYAHNGGKFDYHFLLDAIESGTKVQVINGRISKLKFGKAELRDSLNILPFPLKMMQKDKFKYWKLEKEFREKYKDEILKYLKGDCVYLHKYILDFILKFGSHLTQASGAFKIWHKMSGLEEPVMIGKKGAAYYDKFAKYYYGGRVTPFKKGIFEGAFDMIDIKSAYPKIMKNDHPYGFRYTEGDNPPDSKLHLSVLTVVGKSYGAFPYRHGHKLDFFEEKEGVFNVTGHEFKTALETNTFRCDKIIKSYTWQDSINFSEYVDYFYAMKQKAEKEGDNAGRLFAKIFLNALYGKYCANPRKYEESIFIDIWPELEEKRKLMDDGFEPGVFLGNNRLWQKKIDYKKWRFHNIITGASITGQVRAFLWDSILKVDTPYYCDTDSIICKNLGELKLGKNLGDWDREMTGDKLAIAGKKLYCISNKKDHKLASKGAKLSKDEIFRVAKGEEITYRQDAPVYSLKNGVNFLKRKINKI